MSCFRCARAQKKYRLLFLSKNCVECIRIEKKCESNESIVYFARIDKALEKLNREKLKIETAWEAANEQTRVASEQARFKLVKLKRLRQQRRFLKEREQKMFDKGLDDVEKLKRLK